MFSNWQRKYEDEAERLVEVLRQWYELESAAKRLEWELGRCQYPEASEVSEPGEARKPALLRRAEAGKPVVPDTKHGMEQSWKNRYKEVSTYREDYEVLTSRLTRRVERLEKKLADCEALRAKALERAGHKAAQLPAETGSARKDVYERMPPAMRRMREQLEKVRQQNKTPIRQEPSSSFEERIEEIGRAEQPVQAEKETPVEKEKLIAQKTPVEKEKPVEEEKRVAQETPEAAPAPPPPREAPRKEAGPSWQEKYQALKQDHEALARALQEAQGQLKQMTARIQSREKELRAREEAADEITQKQAAERHALEALPVLAKHFRQGQRSFLAQPDAPDVGLELANLIYYALTHLAVALASGEKTRAQAMYANLHTIARNLQSYKMTTLHGFDAALEMLRALPGGDAAQYAARLRRSPQSPGADAQPIRTCLKMMRDKASVELRPFFYNIDAEGEVITIG